MMLPTFFLALVLAVHVGKGQDSAQRSLLLVGGHLADDNEAIYGKFVEISGGKGVAKIGIVTAASADPMDSANFYLNIFKTYGAVETYWIPAHENNLGAAWDPAVVEKVNEMTGFFFGGGDQARVINSLFLYDNDKRIESSVMEAIRNRFENGLAAAGGTSAGAACMPGSIMLKQGVSYDALVYGASTDSPHPDDLVYDPDGGIGLLPGFVVDTHFSQRGREGRMIRLLSDTQNEMKGTKYGIGVDENTALWVTSNVDGSGKMGEVIGEAGVYLVDVGSSAVSEVNQQWSIETVYTTFLTNGDKINLDTWVDITYAPHKSNLEGNELNDHASSSTDIFGGNYADETQPPELTRVATSLVNARLDESTTGITYEDNPTFQLTFVKGSYTKGFGGYLPDDPDSFDISYQDLIVDIVAI